MASEVSICNQALQKLGASRITSLTEDSRNARAVNACYVEMRDAELRAHPWNFGRKRVVLSPDSTAPVFDYGYAFTLPTDCLRPLPPARTGLDWQIEGGKILTNDGTTINLRYVRRVADPNEMDPCFRDMVACRIAAQVCEEITQSNTKLESIQAAYKMSKLEAKRANAFEQNSDDPPDDTWITARL
ncbi:MAG: hypothetical protein V4641_13075 [Pseudomonadota bacterium]